METATPIREAPREDRSGGGAARVAHALAELALHLAFPRGCAACEAPLRARAVFCATCAASVELAAWRGNPFRRDDAVFAAAYGGAVARALHRLKYCGKVEVAAQLGELLKRPAAFVDVDLVVPVPLHPRRLADRGFNQAALLARRIAPRGRFAPDAVARVRDTPQQTRFARAERALNVAGAFRARADRVAGKSVLLVDDVVTTGATLRACRAALFQAGAAQVKAVTVAGAT